MSRHTFNRLGLYCKNLVEKLLILGILRHFWPNNLKKYNLILAISLFCSYLCQKVCMVLYPGQNNVL